MNYSIEEILAILPHRPPFLLVDRIIDGEDGKWALGIKNVTMNENFFSGHFPGRPIMPGVLIVEAMAQVGAVAFLSQKKGKEFILFRGIESMKFKRQVVPGDCLEMRADLLDFQRGLGRAKVVAKVEGKVAAMGEISFVAVTNDL